MTPRAREHLVGYCLLAIPTLLVAFILLMACQLPRSTDGAYPTHVLAYQHLEDVDQSTLGLHDVIIVSRSGWPGLDPEHHARTLLYIDVWGSSLPSRAEHLEWYWQPGPADYGQQEWVLEWTPGRDVYCYNWTDGKHPDRFQAMCAKAMDHGVLGIFADDWGPNRFWWAGADSVKRAVWPFYPDGRWIWEQVQEAEKRMVREVFRVAGKQGLAVFNGPASQLPGSIQFHENVGHSKESWERLTEPGVDSWRFVLDGERHLLHVRGLLADGSISPAGLVNLQRAAAVALQAPGLISVGLSYQETPAQGGSVYQLPQGHWADPRNWPNYVKK